MDRIPAVVINLLSSPEGSDQHWGPPSIPYYISGVERSALVEAAES
jgi:hypothetical protein